MPTMTRCLLVAACVCANMLVAKGQPFGRVCAIAELAPIYTVRHDPETGEISFVSIDIDGEVDFPLLANNSNRALFNARPKYG